MRQGLAVLLLGVFSSVITAEAASIAKIFFVAGNSNVDILLSAIAIYAADADGTHVVKLTTVPGDGDTGISVSLDRSKIAFVSARDGRQKLYTMNTDGTGQVKIPNTQPGDSAPSLSPDNLKVAFAASSNVYVMDIDGSHRTNLTNNGGDNQAAAWSPDGTTIAYCSRPNTGSPCKMWMMDPDGSNQHQVTDIEVGGIAWSPDGTHLAFSTMNNAGLFTVRPDGSHLTQIIGGGLHPFGPQWTLDGKGIVFKSTNNGFNLYTINSDGTDETQLTHFVDGVIPVEPTPEPEPLTEIPEPSTLIMMVSALGIAVMARMWRRSV